MKSAVKAFFTEIASNKELQKKLYHTKEVADVSVIANEMGFDITAVDVLRAQAGRLIELSTSKVEEALLATAGKKPNIGAQWGREGYGFLERAGYWIIRFLEWGVRVQSYNQDLTRFMDQVSEDKALQQAVNQCRTINEVEKVAQDNHFEVSAVSLLVYQALCILNLDEKQAELVAQGSTQ